MDAVSTERRILPVLPVTSISPNARPESFVEYRATGSVVVSPPDVTDTTFV